MTDKYTMQVTTFSGLDERYWREQVEPKYRQALIKGGASGEMIDHVCVNLKEILLTQFIAIPLNFPITESEAKVMNKVLKNMAGDSKTIVDQLMIEIMKQLIKFYEYEKEE